MSESNSNMAMFHISGSPLPVVLSTYNYVFFLLSHYPLCFYHIKKKHIVFYFTSFSQTKNEPKRRKLWSLGFYGSSNTRRGGRIEERCASANNVGWVRPIIYSFFKKIKLLFYDIIMSQHLLTPLFNKILSIVMWYFNINLLLCLIVNILQCFFHYSLVKIKMVLFFIKYLTFFISDNFKKNTCLTFILRYNNISGTWWHHYTKYILVTKTGRIVLYATDVCIFFSIVISPSLICYFGVFFPRSRTTNIIIYRTCCIVVPIPSRNPSLFFYI